MQLSVETHAVLLIPIRPIYMQIPHFAVVAFEVKKNRTLIHFILVEGGIVHAISLVPQVTLHICSFIT